MVNENYAYAYCIEDISKIENYDKAIADTTQTWVCHHRLEMQDEHFNSAEYLKKNNLYYHRPAAELIFLTRGEHTKLHSTGRSLSEESCRKISEANKGRKFSEEHKAKIAKALEGNTNTLGMKHTMESKLKISESNKGRIFTDEHRENLRKSLKGQNKGTHWYNDGKINMRTYTCPEGFVKGKLNDGE